MKNYYFIGGAPLTGKSTIIKKLNNYVGISTDEIRRYLQNILKPEENLDLFYGEDLDPITFYEKYKDAETVFAYEYKQTVATQAGVDSLIKSDFSWQNIAIEGIAITPEYLNYVKNNFDVNFKYIFLYDDNESRIRERLFRRGLIDDADKYPDYIKEIELEWVIMYNNYYKEECAKHGYKIYSVDEIDSITL